MHRALRSLIILPAGVLSTAALASATITRAGNSCKHIDGIVKVACR